MALQNLQYACLRIIVNTSLYNRRSSWFSPEKQLDCFKTYSSRSDLWHSRIFSPRKYVDDEKLPLIISVHGGGFILDNPSADDPLARYLSDAVNRIVVSIGYRKAPQSKVPLGLSDVVEMVFAIFNDHDLPLDSS